jgi:hypothetical protein
MFVVLAVPCDIPLFGRIDVIYVQDLVCYLLVTKFQADYDDHLSAYSIDAQTNCGIAVYQIENLLDYYPLSAYVVKNKKYIVLKNFEYNHDDFMM